MEIESLALVRAPLSPKVAAAPAVAAAGAPVFAEKLASLVADVEHKSAEANEAVTGMLDKTGDVHEAMIALQRAETSLQLTVADPKQAGAGVPGHHADAGLTWISRN